MLALDWPGYGQSTLVSPPELADILLFYQTLKEFLKALALPSAIFIGNSLGGNVAARLASEAPEQVKALVLVAPGGFTPQNVMSRFFCRFQGSRSPYYFARLYLKKNTVTTQAMLARAASVQSMPERLRLNRAMWRSFGKAQSDLREVAKKIQAPCLLLFGQAGPLIPASKDGKIAKQTISAAHFRILPCGHASFAEVPELFLSEVQTFLQSISAA